MKEYRVKRKFGLYYVQEKVKEKVFFWKWFSWRAVWTDGTAHSAFGAPASYYLEEDAKKAIKRWQLEDSKELEYVGNSILRRLR